MAQQLTELVEKCCNFQAAREKRRRSEDLLVAKQVKQAGTSSEVPERSLPRPDIGIGLDPGRVAGNSAFIYSTLDGKVAVGSGESSNRIGK
jgi:hypothetical protein